MRIALLLIFFCFLNGNIHAQCLSDEVFWEILDVKTFELSDPKRIQYLSTLRKNANDCGFISDSIEAKLNRVIGETYYELQWLDSARYYTRNAIQINSTQNIKANPVHNIACYFNLALIEKSQNRYEDALSALSQCIVLAQKHAENSLFVAKSYGEIALLHYEMGNYEASLQEARLGELHARNCDWLDAQIDLLKKQAYAALALNDEETAEQVIQTLASLIRPSSTSHFGYIHTTIAELRVRQERYPEAIHAYTNALNHYKNLTENPDLYAQTCIDLGKLLILSNGDRLNGLHFFNEAFQTATESRLKAKAGMEIALIYSTLKRWGASLDFYQETLKLLIPQFKPTSLSANPIVNQVRRNVNKIEILKIIIGKANVLLDSLKSSTLNLELKDLTANIALQSYKTADSLLNHTVWQYYENTTFWEKLAESLYPNALELCFLANKTNDALLFIEKGKFLKWRNQFNETHITSVFSSTELELYQKANQEIIRVEKILVQSDCSESDRAFFQESLTRAYEHRERLVLEKLGKLPYFKNLITDRTIVDVRRLRQEILLPMEGAYLTYFGSKEWIYGLLVTPENVQLRKIPSKRYQSAAHQYLKLLAQSGMSESEFSRFLQHANSLFRNLFEPFPFTTERRIIVSPHEEFIPFEAFSLSSTHPDYLVNTFAFSYTFSSAYLDPRTTERKTFPFFKTFYNLVAYNNEGSARTSQQAGLNSIGTFFLLPKTVTGADATAARFLTEATHYSVLNLAVQTNDNSLFPSLEFPDSSVDMRALFEYGIKSQLLVFSTCSAPDLDNYCLKKSQNLVQYFLSLGASSAMTYLWNIGEEFRTQGLNMFFKHIKYDTPLDLALQKAKKELFVHDDEMLVQPGRWAGALLIGNSVPVATNKEVYWGLMVGFTIFILTLYTTFIYQKKRKRRFARLRKKIAENQES